jgi:uncharacterized protein YceK
MKKTIVILAALISVCLSGCASIATESAATVAATCTVAHDDFLKFTCVRSGEATFASDDIGGGGAFSYFFRADRKDGSEQIVYMIGVDSLRSNWAFWTNAIDLSGKRFTLDEATREVMTGPGTPSVWEVSYATVDRSYLEAIAEKGGTWRVYAEHGGAQFSFAPQAVLGFLSRCDQVFGNPDTAKKL